MAQQFPQDYSPFEPLNGYSQQPPVRKRPGVAAVAAMLVLILAVMVILNESVLKIRSVAVVGNRKISWGEVVAAAGLERPVGYFSVNEKKIAQGVESNRYLIFEKMEKNFPDSLTLFVREREIAAAVVEMGALYYLDEEGMVLERREMDRTVPLQTAMGGIDMLVITGLKPKDLRVGRVIVAGSAAHTEAYQALLKELRLQGFVDEVSELNITDPENIYLITLDGYTAHLGDISQLRAKIGTVRGVVAKLREMGKRGGMLEAVNPGEAIYTPGDM